MTRFVSTMTVALAFAACSGDTGTTTVTSDTGDACPNAIVQAETFPEPGSNNVYYRSNIRVEILAADAAATVTLRTADGIEVAGDATNEDTTLTFTPAEPLTPSTDYVVELNYECGLVEIPWRTSDVGGPLAEDVVGKVYELDLAGGEWREPPGVGQALATLAADVEVLVSPTEVTTDISFLGGLGTGDDEQNVCSETFLLEGATFEDPFFQLSTPLLPFNVGGINVDIENLNLSGAFSPNGDELAGMVLQGTVDTRSLSGLIGEPDNPNAACDLVLQLANVACEECADGSGAFCLSVLVENISAPEVNTELATITTEDVNTNPGCGETTSTNTTP